MPTCERIIPLLVSEDMPAAHDVLANAFGFEAGGVECISQGHPVHGTVRAGASTIELHRVTVEHRLSAPLVAERSRSDLGVHVDDVHAHDGRARFAGAKSVSEPPDRPDGQRTYGAREDEPCASQQQQSAARCSLWWPRARWRA